MDVLRIATAGSVDDGKSSLIGRLLYDTKSIYEDQYASIERASAQRGSDQVELALLTDGLRAEREQNITIDVAYRYFSTPRRKFIIADTPGHVQYTRNMVTGTSNADVSVILVDATKGILPQSRRHAAISILLRVPNLVVAVNKMDLVDFSEGRFGSLESEFRATVDRLGQAKLTFIPISALLGDNVVESSSQTPWYAGPTLLEFLEAVEPTPLPLGGPFRMPVQTVLRPGDGYRALAGTVSSGRLALGERVVVLPEKITTTVKSLRVAGEVADSAEAGEAVAVELGDNVDASRGSLLVSEQQIPLAGRTLEAVVCWLGERPLEPGEPFYLLHGTRRLGATVESILGAVNLETLELGPSPQLAKNDLGKIRLRLSDTLYAETFAEHRELGAFVLVDRGDYVTVAAGMIERAFEQSRSSVGSIYWVEGSTEAFVRELRANGESVRVLSFDELTDLLEDASDDATRLKRVRAVAKLLATDHVVVIPIADSTTVRENLGENEQVVTR